jgi:hypothetical protein
MFEEIPLEMEDTEVDGACKNWFRFIRLEYFALNTYLMHAS